jgi:antirestriction protein ArdC
MTPSSIERRQQSREQLEAAVEALAQSDGWQAWLRTRATFRQYSISNQFLIAMQRPDATRVAGFKAWQKLGRQVRKGEKGIRILAPRTYKEKDENGDETGEVGLYFVPVCVFALEQTDGDALPEPPREPISGDSHAHLLPMLEQYAGTLGYRVEYVATGSNALGYCDMAASRIVVAPEQPANAKVRTLLHELVHALGVDYDDYSRADAEVIVESAGHIAASSIGLDTSGEAVAYVAGWGDGNADTIRTYAEKVDELASKLEAACGVQS